MHLDPMVFRFTASGPTAETAFTRHAAEDRVLPVDPFARRADLSRVTRITVVRDRSALGPVVAGYFNDSAPSPVPYGAALDEDDAEWLADRLIEDDAPCVRSGGAGALLLKAAGPEPSWLLFGWSAPLG
ncbi:hypothetical protein [Streptomyces lavendulae]|uniref:hypothetical protein n=1 Tax=Streptomyces lavendulae TaxID=1914 RepID=UPI0024A396D1|nr:hypothetical protein [Streptomyces lavendulae]GLX22434.1 hypothetical protein Slala01_60780 [Streptomyces lavendulae subsp. lavendulae]GLX29918.1 hypothetical protein Slala02_57380 [Streptomyces lavendulae subsp. lavendulae]